MSLVVTIDTTQHSKYVQGVKRLFLFVSINRVLTPFNNRYRLVEKEGWRVKVWGRGVR